MKKVNKFYVLLLTFLVTSFLFSGVDHEYSIRTYRVAWGLGHFVCFSLWAYLYSLFRSHLRFRRYLIEVLLITFILGGLSELIQPYFGRTALWTDLWQDMVGGMLGAVFIATHRKQLPVMKLRLLQLSVALILLFYLLPLGQVLIDDAIAWRQFPVLSNFETPLEQTRWGQGVDRAISHDTVYAGMGALRVDLATSTYSGIALKHFPRDWSSYNAVTLQIFNSSSDPLPLSLRIHDVHHNYEYSDRFNTRFLLHNGWNQLLVPLLDVESAPETRQLDLSRIGGLGVFVVQQQQPHTIYIDEVRLIP